MASMLFKTMLAGVLGGPRLFKRVAPAFAVTFLVAIAVLLFG